MEREMDRPIVFKGILQGKTITLDENTFLPDGYRITLHLVLESDEALRLSYAGCADMTPEEIASFEETLTALRGRPFKIPRRERSGEGFGEAGPDRA